MARTKPFAVKSPVEEKEILSAKLKAIEEIELKKVSEELKKFLESRDVQLVAYGRFAGNQIETGINITKLR